jgi:lipid II:glycine glycyltransferase (peptidoglycan interpeptide bridge formation enzyme)
VERVRLSGGGLASVLIAGAGPWRWGYVPRGPVPTGRQVLEELAAWARSQGLARLVLEPDAGPDAAEELTGAGFGPVAGRQPEQTLIVRLTEPEAMLASFKPKHRYNIRLAARHGVEVEEGEDVDEMARQQAATAGRQGIAPYRAEVYARRLELLPWCRIYVARHEGEALAAITVARHGGRAYYLYGGSIESKRHLMATYAVQWAAMQAAFEAGCREYDLWGIPPAPDPSHPWFGLWQFKKGFGGALLHYVGAWQIVLSRWAHVARAGAVSRNVVKRLHFRQR